MSERAQLTPPDLGRLPPELLDRLTSPFARFLRIETLGGTVLLAAAVAALLLSNSSWAHVFANIWETPIGIHVGSLEFSRSLRDWINDAVMTLFFFLVAVELKRELVLGELSNVRVAALSIAAALGGMLMPATLYLLLQYGQAGATGWGTVMATDTAFVIGCLALLGSRIPQILRVFMLSVAIVDDIGAILVVAIGYSEAIVWQVIPVAVVGVAVIHVMTRVGVRSVPLYFVAGGFSDQDRGAGGSDSPDNGCSAPQSAPPRLAHDTAQFAKLRGFQNLALPHGWSAAMRGCSSVKINSTRRFDWRPSALSLVATGKFSPLPSAET